MSLGGQFTVSPDTEAEVLMRGNVSNQGAMFSYVSLADRIPKHPPAQAAGSGRYGTGVDGQGMRGCLGQNRPAVGPA